LVKFLEGCFSTSSLAPLIPVGRPQNRSGIRNSLTRLDLVLGRLLVHELDTPSFLSKKDKSPKSDALLKNVAFLMK
jgi:hypothetical protein